METTDLVSCDNRQIDRWGNTLVTPEQFTQACLGGRQINDRVFVTELDPEIRQYNRFADDKVHVYDPLKANTLSDANFNWNIPQRYLEIDVMSHALDKLVDQVHEFNLDDQAILARSKRIQREIKLMRKHNLTEMFQCLIYIIDRMVEHKQVWGLGRGSSVASYILYLIGVHDVDSVKFDIDPLEFFKN